MSETTEPGSYFVSNYPPFDRWTASAVPAIREAFASPPRADVPLGLYLHIPFCRKRCRFCYFRVYTDKAAGDVERYTQGVVREAELAASTPAVDGRELKYVYFGGGTPSFLSVRQLERLVEGLHDSFGWDAAEEVTFECEPGTLSEPKVRALRSLGMTRISLGVENFDDDILRENGRAHLSPEIMKAWEWIVAAGFPNTNIDLIAGMVGETDESWDATLEKTLALTPDSVTIYQMELPLNTTLVHDWKQTGVPAPVADWPTKRAWVDRAFRLFEEAGYQVSSGYTLVRDPGRVSFRYRDMLWEGSDLVALGVASFGHLSGLHYQNEAHWDDYLASVEAGTLPLARGLVPSRRELLIREMILGLKRGRLDASRLERKFGVDVLAEWEPIWASLEREGHLQRADGAVHLSRGGLLRVDSLLHRFFEPASPIGRAAAS
jgi:oxygen-independent coproporphyrinogen-3 oxidase